MRSEVPGENKRNEQQKMKRKMESEKILCGAYNEEKKKCVKQWR